MKICTLRNENLYFAKWKSVLGVLVSLKRRSQNLGLQNFSQLVCRKFRRRTGHWALSIVLSPALLSAPGGPALLCFATRWLHKFDISTPPSVLRSRFWARHATLLPHQASVAWRAQKRLRRIQHATIRTWPLCWLNIACRKCTMKERVIPRHFLPCFACTASSCKNIKHLVRNSSLEVRVFHSVLCFWSSLQD